MVVEYLLVFLSSSFTCLLCESEPVFIMKLCWGWLYWYRWCRSVESSPVNEDETGADHVLW